MRILGISGSLRTGSYNTKALKAAQLLVPAGVELDIYTLQDLPLYNADVEKEGIPASVAALREAIVAADAVLICTPEYNYSLSGVLKNALDWLSQRLQWGHGEIGRAHVNNAKRRIGQSEIW